MAIVLQLYFVDVHRFPGTINQQMSCPEGVSSAGSAQQIYSSMNSLPLGQGSLPSSGAQSAPVQFQGQQQLQQLQPVQQQLQQQQMYSQPLQFLSQNGNTDYVDEHRLGSDVSFSLFLSLIYAETPYCIKSNFYSNYDLN